MNTGSRKIAVKTIRGTLTPTNAEGVKVTWNRQSLYHAFLDNELEALVSHESSKWVETSLHINSSSPIRINDHHDILTFIDRLANLMKTDIATDLCMNGSFTVVADTGNEPLVFKVRVNENHVSYQRASYVWSEDTKVQ